MKKLGLIHTVMTVYLLYRILNIAIVGGIQAFGRIDTKNIEIKDPQHYYTWEPHEPIPELQDVLPYEDLPFCQRAFMSKSVYESNTLYDIKAALMNIGFILLPWTSVNEQYQLNEKGWYSEAEHILRYEVFVYNGINVFTHHSEQYFVYVGDVFLPFIVLAVPFTGIVYVIYSIARIQNALDKSKDRSHFMH
ncbi:MAG: hypothetical protein J6I96_01040 [Oscillospiraceae bacterium]|nr:hypothetical protein [Oscillospiraceae bacterium]